MVQDVNGTLLANRCNYQVLQMESVRLRKIVVIADMQHKVNNAAQLKIKSVQN